MAGPIARYLSGFSGALAALKVPAYRDFTIGNMVSVVGTWLQRVATGWLTWQLTELPGWLGILVFVDLITMITVGPLAGAVADRMNRQHVMIAAQFVMLGQATLLAVFYAAGVMTIELLLALTFLLGIGHGMHTAARMSLVPSLVPKPLLAPAIGINALTHNVARFIGPAIAGFVILTWGLAPAFALNALSYLPLIWALWRLRIVTPDDMRKPQGGLFRQIAEGMRYARDHAGIGPLILIASVASFAVRAFPDMLPGFSAQMFDRGAEGLAALTSAMGVGAMAGGILLAGTNGTAGLTRRLVWNLASMTLAVVAFVASQSFWMGLVFSAWVGFVMTTNGITTQTLIQSSVDGAMRGRVMSTYTTTYLGSAGLGGLLLGALGEHIGLRAAFSYGAALCALAFIWLWRKHRFIAPALEGDSKPAAREAAQ